MQPSLVKAAETLYRNAAAVRAVERHEMNQFTRALEALERLSASLDAPLAVVGGLAAIHHGVAVITLHIDVVVPREVPDAVLSKSSRCGLSVRRISPDGWHRLAFADEQGEVPIEIIPAGSKSPRIRTMLRQLPHHKSLVLRRDLVMRPLQLGLRSSWWLTEIKTLSPDRGAQACQRGTGRKRGSTAEGAGQRVSQGLPAIGPDGGIRESRELVAQNRRAFLFGGLPFGRNVC